MRIHFIACGGSIMHYLAIVMKEQGNEVTGSDDHIFDPAKSNLEKHGLLPLEMGFFLERISTDIEMIVLGMHARKDNPELLRAQALGLNIYSFPQFIFEVSKEKRRVVVSGSHGKTSITAMIMHVLKTEGLHFDYLVGAQLKGFVGNVSISKDAPLMIIEGDEYLASPIHPESKFLSYHPHVALMSGVAWDHINVFPVYADYVQQFQRFAESILDNGSFIYFQDDEEVNRIAQTQAERIALHPYSTARYEVMDHQTYVYDESGNRYALEIFGQHNLQNLEGARLVCQALGISSTQFYTAIQHFEGAANRLTKLVSNDQIAIYKDFAHSPSKLKATVAAMKLQYPDRHLVACMELHTFSSLSKAFLKEYHDAMKDADTAIVYYSPEVLAQKKLEAISAEDVGDGFNRKDLIVVTDKQAFLEVLNGIQWSGKNLLLMSSGDFGGISINDLTAQIAASVSS